MADGAGVGTLRQNLLRRLDTYHRQGLRGARAGLRLAIAGRDRDAPQMAEIRELTLPSPYGDLPGRLYRPHAATAKGPVLLFFPGGGFVLGDLEVYDGLCRRLADAADVTVICARYRLAPEAAFPAQLADGEAWACWVKAQADELDVDPDSLALGGDSAGAYVAIAATTALNAQRAGAIAAQILIYPLLQLDDAVWASTLIRDSRIVGRLAVRYIRAQLRAEGATIPSLLDAPLAAPPPPTLIVTGGVLDPVRPDCLRYYDRLKAAGTRVTLSDYPPLMHGFANLTHILPAAREAVREIGEQAGAMLRDGATTETRS